MMQKKIRVGILFGGKSAEHEVSLQSAKNVVDALDKEKYEAVLIGIDKTGRWLLNDASNFLLNADNPKLIKLFNSEKVVTLAPENAGTLVVVSGESESAGIDVVFPILHGPFGEDGTVQGFLKLADLPFVGSDVLGAAVGMDKDVMKRLLQQAGIPVPKFLTFRSFQKDQISFAEVEKTLGLPFFVKPANLGSSVGVSKVHTEAEFTAAITEAFDFDTKILIEEGIEGREIECAVLGNDHPRASVPGEVVVHSDFYSYEAKYIDENGAGLQIPAKITDQEKATIQKLAIQTFQVLECSGLGRVDSFLKKDGTVLVNEINTMPGFTKVSMYPKMWEASGIGYSALIDQLIQLGIERYNQRKQLKSSYSDSTRRNNTERDAS